MKRINSSYKLVELLSGRRSGADTVVDVATIEFRFRAIVLTEKFVLDSLRRRANARNVSFRISLRWLTYVVNSVDKTKLSG